MPTEKSKIVNPDTSLENRAAPAAMASSSEDSFDKIEKEILAASQSRRPPPVSASLAISAAQPQANIIVRELEPESPPTISEGFA